MKSECITGDVFQFMEQLAPRQLAYDWDPVGLQVGSHNKPVKKVMVTLDVLEAVVDEAIAENVDVIIAHHPLLFKPVQQINTTTPTGRIIQKLLTNDITVYAAHTNLDITKNGVNDALCDAIGITNTRVLVEKESEQLIKLAVYVPRTHVEEVRNAISEAGAGHIGNYSHCTFQTTGLGTFKPLKGTNPFIGSVDQLERVEEVKLESIIEQSKLPSALNAIRQSHPYEEPAYDLFPLKNEGNVYGLGRIGELTKTVDLKTFCNHVKASLKLDYLRVIGRLDKQVKTVAVLGGSGEKFIHQAKRQGADVFITGDMTFHLAQDAQEMGLAVIDAGHYAEKVMKTSVQGYLISCFSDTNVEVIVSTTNTNPFQYV